MTVTTNSNKKNIRVAIAGLGAIGKSLSTHLASGAIPGVVLTAVSAKDHQKAQEFVKTLAHPVKVLKIEDQKLLLLEILRNCPELVKG